MHNKSTDPSARAATRPATEPARHPSSAGVVGPDPLELSLQQLAALLDRQPQARLVLRALAKLEEALARRGWSTLDKMPLAVLERARDQLEGLVSNWSPAGLATLRSKLAVALIERDEFVVALPCEDYRTTFLLDVHPAAASPAPPQRQVPAVPGIAPAPAGPRWPAQLQKRRAAGAQAPVPTPAPAPLRSPAAGLHQAVEDEQDLAALMAIYASLGGVLHPQREQTQALRASVVAAKARQLQARQAALAHWR